MRLIDADALMERFAEMQKVKPDKDGQEYACNFLNMGGEPSAEWFTVEDAVENAPTVDAVPIGAVEQIRWERDMAMQQLSEHGIPFGGKADDVIKVCRCKDCIEYRDCVGACHYFNYEPTDEMDFCSHGIRADGERKDDETDR